MKAYALTWDGLYANLMVATCPDLDDAKAAVDASRSNAGVAAASPEDLALSGPALAGLYAKLADLAGIGGTTPSRFATRGDGQRRVFALLEENFKTAPEAAAPPASDTPAVTDETTTQENDDVATKGKKAKKVKVAQAGKKVRTPKAPREKKERKLKATIVSKGGEKSKAVALEMIQHKMGATAQEIAEKLELSLGSAKNLVWYLKRDGNKIVVNKESDRKPYVIG